MNLEEYIIFPKNCQQKMLNEKKLVKLFKDFFEKACLSYIRQNNLALRQWLYFSSLLSQQFIDYSKIEKYVDGLMNNKKDILTQKSNNIYSHSSSLNKVLSIGSFQKTEDDFFPQSKYIVNNSFGYGRTFSLDNFKSDNQISKPYQSSVFKQKVQKNPMSKFMSSLNKLYQTFSCNQRKFQKKQVKSPIYFQNNLMNK